MQKFTMSESLASSTVNVLAWHPVLVNFARPKENRNFSKLFNTDVIALEFCERALYAKNSLCLSWIFRLVLMLIWKDPSVPKILSAAQPEPACMLFSAIAMLTKFEFV